MSQLPGNRSAEVALPQVRAVHFCFGCGAQNPIGLKLKFHATTDGIAAHFLPGTNHQGYDDVIHGGILSAVLDEVMAWAVAATGIWAVTGEMRTRFRQPLRVGEGTIASGSITDARGRVISTRGTIVRDADGVEIATATATFVRVDDATAASWQSRYLPAPDQGIPE